MRTALLAIVTACTTYTGPQLYDCKNSITCDTETQSGTFTQCMSEEEMKKEEASWVNVCEEALGLSSCGSGKCVAECTPTGTACKE